MQVSKVRQTRRRKKGGRWGARSKVGKMFVVSCFGRLTLHGLLPRNIPDHMFRRAVGKTCSLPITEEVVSLHDVYRPGPGRRKNCPVNHSGLPWMWLAGAERMGGACRSYSRLFSCRGGACRGVRDGGGVYVTSQTFGWWCEETPDELKVKQLHIISREYEQKLIKNEIHRFTRAVS